MEQLGINPILILVQVANFLLLLWVLKKYLYKPFIELLDKRRQDIEATDNLRHELETEKAHIDEERERVLNEVRTEADQMLDEVREQGKQIQEQMRKEAQERADHIVTSAKKEISEREQVLRAELQQEVREAAVEAAEAVLATNVTQQQRNELLAKAVDRFGS